MIGQIGLIVNGKEKAGLATSDSTAQTTQMAQMDLMTGGTIVNITQIGIPTGAPMISDKTQIGKIQLGTLTTQMAHLHMMTTTMTTMTTMTMEATKNCMKTLNHTTVYSQLQPASNSN